MAKNISSFMKFKFIELPKIEDHRGILSVIEKDIIPFTIKRIYFLYNIPHNVERGAHSHKQQQSVLFALNGSFEIILNDGIQSHTVFLDTPNKGLFIPNGYWRELKNFSSGSVCLVISSDEYDENDYIRNYQEFLSFKNSPTQF